MEKKKAEKTSIPHFEVIKDTAGVCVNITLKCKVAFCPDDVALRAMAGNRMTFQKGIWQIDRSSLWKLVNFVKRNKKCFHKIT